MKQPVPVTDQILTGDQPDDDDIRALAHRGVRTVINLRPPDELLAEGADPAAEERAVRAAGMTYVSVPVTLDTLTPQALEAFSRAVGAADGATVFAHCRLGQRAAVLALADHAKRTGMTADEALAKGEEVQAGITDPRAQAFLRTVLDS